MTLSKVMGQDIEVASTKSLYYISAEPRYNSWHNVVRFWAMKVISFGYMYLLPVYGHGWAR